MRISKLWLTLILLAAAVLGGLFYTGILDWNRTRTQVTVRANQTLNSATQGVSLDLSTTPATAEEARMAQVCQKNLRRIEAAKRVVAQRRGNAVGAVTWKEIEKELGREKVICPKGGTYGIGTLEGMPTCSVAGQGTSDTRDDHFIRNF